MYNKAISCMCELGINSTRNGQKIYVKVFVSKFDIFKIHKKNDYIKPS